MRHFFILNTIEKKYFYVSRAIRCFITLIYPILAIILPRQAKAFLLPAWFIVFLGAEYFQELYLRRIITKPIKSITDTAKEIANLNFHVRCTVTSDDELGNLSESLNTMSLNLQNALNDLNIANKKLKKDVQHERVMLEQRKELVDSLSHEMKTPLSLIGAYTEGLKLETSEEKRQQYMSAISSATERMNHMIISLLDLSSLEAGASCLLDERFDFVELAEIVGGRLLLDVPGAAYNFTYELPEEKLFVFADKQRMEQILENLIGNAKRYVEADGEICLTIKRENDKLYFSVFNQGTSIPEHDISRIWSKFYKGENTKHNSSGLGLSIVSQILSMYQVPYGVKNISNGVVFYFYFPICESS